MITRKEALNTLAQHYDLSLVYEIEPARLEQLIDLALTCDDPQWRRADQSLLNLIAGHIVGKEANHPLLRSSRYEDALLTFIDWLLPEGSHFSTILVAK